MRHFLSPLFSKYRLELILLVSLINGLAYMFLVPPWQHYDEPGHFEYAWLVANWDHWPQAGENDQLMRREVAASMIEHDFYRGMPTLPNLMDNNEQVGIGMPQTGDLPIYYFLVSFPLRIMKFNDITWQLYSARLVSVLLFVFTIWLAYKTSSLIFGKEHPLTWMVPIFIAFLPAFVDLMSAVNNDVGAIAFFTLFGYTAVRLIKKGVTLFNLVLFLAAMALCVFTKSTAWLALPLSGLTLVIALYKKKWLWFYSLLGLVGIIIVGFVLFDWNNPTPAYFYASSDWIAPRSINSQEAPVGEKIIAQSGRTYKGRGFDHVLNPKKISDLGEKRVTLGFWSWSDKATVVRTPILIINGNEFEIFDESLNLSVEKQFYVFSILLPEKISNAWFRTFALTEKGNSIYFDGIFLISGDYKNLCETPHYVDPNGQRINCNGQIFDNLIKNGSGEKIWLIGSQLINKLLYGRVNFSTAYFWSIFDLQSNGWYYRSALSHIFRSFWAIFGWSHVFLVGGKPYRFLLLVSLLSLPGLGISLFKGKIESQGRIVLLLSTMIILQLIMVVMRGAGSWFIYTMLPAARYFFPVILPVAIFLVMGWYYLFKKIFGIIWISAKFQASIYILSLIMLEVWAFYTIHQFYK